MRSAPLASGNTLESPTVPKHRRVSIYLRVSTDGQTTENQRLELHTAIAARGWTLVQVYSDNGISGAKGREKRPAFDQLLKDAVRRQFDVIAAWSVDRLGRSLQDLVAFLGEVHGAGVDLYLHQQAIDTTAPAGKAMFQMMGVFAEFERAMIRERINAGLARARAQGKRLGRPPVDATAEARVREFLAAGHGVQKSARLAGVGGEIDPGPIKSRSALPLPRFIRAAPTRALCSIKFQIFLRLVYREH
jgi:DNA invertase Pin-like site-specific DNA recombinase